MLSQHLRLERSDHPRFYELGSPSVKSVRGLLDDDAAWPPPFPPELCGWQVLLKRLDSLKKYIAVPPTCRDDFYPELKEPFIAGDEHIRVSFATALPPKVFFLTPVVTLCHSVDVTVPET